VPGPPGRYPGPAGERPRSTVRQRHRWAAVQELRRQNRATTELGGGVGAAGVGYQSVQPTALFVPIGRVCGEADFRLPQLPDAPGVHRHLRIVQQPSSSATFECSAARRRVWLHSFVRRFSESHRLPAHTVQVGASSRGADHPRARLLPGLVPQSARMNGSSPETRCSSGVRSRRPPPVSLRTLSSPVTSSYPRPPTVGLPPTAETPSHAEPRLRSITAARRYQAKSRARLVIAEVRLTER
jgi:hypothetical protein